MFYYISLEHDVLLHPRFFGPEVLRSIKKKLVAEVRGISMGQNGFVLTVACIDQIGFGVIQPVDGFVAYPVKYTALAFRPLNGEILKGAVKEISEVGMFVNVGPLSCFISHHSIPAEMQFCPHSKCYKSMNEAIACGDKIRLKIVETRMEAMDIFAIGSLIGDSLGVVSGNIFNDFENM